MTCPVGGSSLSREGRSVRVILICRDLEETEKYLRDEYGQDIVFTLYNEEDANRPR